MCNSALISFFFLLPPPTSLTNHSSQHDRLAPARTKDNWSLICIYCFCSWFSSTTLSHKGKVSSGKALKSRAHPWHWGGWRAHEQWGRRGCQVRGEQAATGFRRSGCWGISVALAAPAPTPAGNCLTMLPWCSQPRLHLHDHYLESIPNASLSITLNSI